MRKRFQNQAGFTLIEMFIVIIIMGILAMIVIPQLKVSTEDAKLNTLKTNLNNLRSVIEIYYQQHEHKYPGRILADGSGNTTTDALAKTAFEAQLTKYSDKTGKTANKLADLTDGVGPYVKGIFPTNPYNDKNDVVCDYDQEDITQKSSSGTNTGWKFYPITGVLVAGDNGNHDNY